MTLALLALALLVSTGLGNMGSGSLEKHLDLSILRCENLHFYADSENLSFLDGDMYT